MSGEHIWSEWIGKVLGGKRRYTFRRVDQEGQILNAWSSDELDLTAKVVCEPCNNDWMSDIEQDHAKPTFAPIIQGKPFCLLPLGIESAAIWAFKVTVIADHMQPNRSPFFIETERTSFRQRLEIPPCVQMWLAAYHEPGHRNGVFKSHYLQFRDARYKGLEYFIVTYGISPLLIQVAACRWPDPARPRIEIPLLTQNSGWDGISAPFLAHPRRGCFLASSEVLG